MALAPTGTGGPTAAQAHLAQPWSPACVHGYEIGVVDLRLAVVAVGGADVAGTAVVAGAYFVEFGATVLAELALLPIATPS